MTASLHHNAALDAVTPRHLSELRADFDAAPQPVAIAPGVVVHFEQIQRDLHSRQVELWTARQRLGQDMHLAIYLTPMPPVTQAVDAITAAIEAVERLRQAFRDAVPADAGR